MKNISNIIIILAIYLTACASTPTVETVERVVFSSSNHSTSPEYHYREELIVNGNLSTKWTRTDKQGKQQRQGKITPEQLARLRQKINNSNYLHVKVEKRRPPRVGCTESSLSITTNVGSRGFANGCFATFPKAIAAIYAEFGELKPPK